ncbi:hypothetical protein, partial [Escherichia coli]
IRSTPSACRRRAKLCITASLVADWPVNRVSELLPWRIALPAE